MQNLLGKKSIAFCPIQLFMVRLDNGEVTEYLSTAQNISGDMILETGADGWAIVECLCHDRD